MKQKLLETVVAGQEREAELAALGVDAPADPDGRWSAKDHLAHLSWWRARNARLMDAVRTGGELPPSVQDDAQNAVIYTENRDRTVDEIKEDARASWGLLRAAVEACSEEDLARPHPYAPGFELWATVPGNGHGHLGQHLMFLYLETRDEEKAEAAQLWVRDLDTRAFPDPIDRANAAYNLACFYGRVGNADKALPLLRAGFDARPELIAHAREDPDLDRIRDHPAVARLLAG
ncbi:MAG TPA: DinB family protein [Candidatus Dormibacteraeota bacterium]|nr:DinB family protein [Candidatus Dormibacteraeota bacterium]